MEFLRLGDINNASEEDVVAAAKESGAHEIIEKLERKYETPLGAHHWWGDTVRVTDLIKRAEQVVSLISAFRSDGSEFRCPIG